MVKAGDRGRFGVTFSSQLPQTPAIRVARTDVSDCRDVSDGAIIASTAKDLGWLSPCLL